MPELIKLTLEEALERARTSKNLARCDLSGLDLTGCDFSNTNLTGSDLSECYALSTDFSNANLKNAIFKNAYLGGAKLYKANLSAADFSGATLVGSHRKQAKYLLGTRLNFNSIGLQLLATSTGWIMVDLSGTTMTFEEFSEMYKGIQPGSITRKLYDDCLRHIQNHSNLINEIWGEN